MNNSNIQPAVTESNIQPAVFYILTFHFVPFGGTVIDLIVVFSGAGMEQGGTWQSARRDDYNAGVP